MAFSPNYSYATSSQNLVKKSPLLLPNSQPLQALYLAKRNVYLHKPLHISAATGLGGPAPGSDVRPPARCWAYEAVTDLTHLSPILELESMHGDDVNDGEKALDVESENEQEVDDDEAAELEAEKDVGRERPKRAIREPKKLEEFIRYR